MHQKQIKGFTLIELIVTVAILAVLTIIVVVALNPAEQLARSRDAKRIADLDAVKTAMNLYLAQATTTINLTGDTTVSDRCVGGTTATLFAVNNGSAISTSTGTGLSALVTSTAQLVATSTVASAGGSWLPALIGQTPGGVPLSNLPTDPAGTGSNTYYYAYACRKSTNVYELTARLESTYFKTDIGTIGTDGGNSTSTYEVGTDLSIISNAF